MTDRRADNVWRARHYRELILLQLQLLGFEDAALRPWPTRLSDAFTDDGPGTHVTGINGWTLHVHSGLQPRWGTSLDAVEQVAALDGTPHAALIAYRKDRPAADHYVLMSLSHWADLVQSRQGAAT